MSLPAAKRTPQILPTGIPWMGNKIYPTMPAPTQASFKMGISSQNRAKNIVVMQDNFPNLTRTVPARGKLKYCLKFSYKYAKVLLIILMFFGMPHSITSIPLIGRMGFSINSLTLIHDKRGITRYSDYK